MISRSRLGRLERTLDLELEARARRVLGLRDSVGWMGFVREYRQVAGRMAAIQRQPVHSRMRREGLPGLQAEARMLAEEMGLGFEDLIGEAERITAQSELDPQATRWLLSRL